MSREIKFRAWDESKNNMMYDLEIRNEPLWWLTSLKLPVMQYTGLKDKNGKEIFEGDIVSFIGLSGESKALVEYDDKLGCYRVKNNYIPNHVRLEVIGNVWENPDLLKGEPKRSFIYYGSKS